ncbi:MAG: peptide-methionine (S)-S-oxide reductase MsrA [Capsulimonadales bacterium]|nr:peptide-methionine (S)-S-oxide reductase MsrA [Capsulimonadales bacterium]
MSREFWVFIGLIVPTMAGLFAIAVRDTAAPRGERLERPKRLPVPANARKATFAGGCFWGVEETFRKAPGVVDTRVGFTGGTSPNPTYESVHQDRTGHVEAVEVTFDPTKTSYERLVLLLFTAHDTTRPGIRDSAMGRQYRSFIFTHDAAQASIAQQTLRTLSKSGKYQGAPRPIATAIRPATIFQPAEEYHQRYYEKRGMASSCALEPPTR